MKDQNSAKFLPVIIPTVLMLIVFGLGCKSSKNISKMMSEHPKTPFENNQNYSAAYHEVVDYYKLLDKTYAEISMMEIGPSDSGKPLHAIIIGNPEIKDRNTADQNGKSVLLINNAIHPGEPCGIDASMMMARDLVTNPEMTKLLSKTVVVIIPVYNISGALNRGSFSRANQLGPEQYGFRGNVQNYDLNRDFIKCDTKNAQTFNMFFNKWDPDVFIDNHTSNGADYQYVITLVATQKDKLHPQLADHMSDKMLPFLYEKMNHYQYEMTPYVYSRNTPEDGIAGFLDLPRYSSGYAALHHTISFMPETHMLKPYKDRVWSTYYFTKSMLNFLDVQGEAVRTARKKAKSESVDQKEFPLNWAIDFDNVDEISFKGYESELIPSEVTGKERLFYNHSKPYEKKVPFYNNYKTISSINPPLAYIIPQAFSAVIDRLKWNNVKMKTLEKDTIMDVAVYYIEDMETSKTPYEGHFLHSKVIVRSENQQLKYYHGDVIIQTNQPQNRYIVEVLEPQGPDSFFAWNFMDGILMRKEYFSSYVFEETAVKLLEQNPQLKIELDKRKSEDPKFAENARAQLNFIYERSPYYEKSYRRYPIGRIMSE